MGNVMVPIVILKTKDMRNSTNIFLVNLSIADLMVLLVCTPSTLVEIMYKPDTWILGKELCLAVPFIDLMVVHASVLTILAISFERYYAICQPFKAGYVCTKTRAAVICALVWFFAALFTSPILGSTTYEYEQFHDGTEYPVCYTEGDGLWMTLFFTVNNTIFFIVPLGILLVLYSIIAKKLMDTATIIAKSNNNTNNSSNVMKYRKQVVLMLGTVIIFFFVCLLPIKAVQLSMLVNPDKTIMILGTKGFYILLYCSKALVYLNSASNPILYNLMSTKFRNGFIKLLGINRLMRCSRNLMVTENMQSIETLNIELN